MASKRAIRRRACESKVAYSREGAVRAARQRARLTGDKISPYHCQFANHWHIGHLPWRVRQAIAARYGSVIS